MDAHGLVAVLLERTPARRICNEDFGHELVKVQLAEGVARPQSHRLAREALAPHALLADHDARRAVRVRPVDLVDPDRADRRAVRLDDPEDVGLRLTDALEEVDLLIERDGGATPEITGHLHVREPRHEARRIAIVSGTERDAITFQNGPEHGPAE